jgi:hypothetical protein
VVLHERTTPEVEMVASPALAASRRRVTSIACAASMLGFSRLKLRSGFYPEGER